MKKRKRNEKYVVELLKKKGIRLYEEEITYVDPFPFEGWLVHMAAIYICKVKRVVWKQINQKNEIFAKKIMMNYGYWRYAMDINIGTLAYVSE